MIKAEYVDHMGSDKRVVDAARVSFNVFNSDSGLTTGDVGLIKFLARGCPKEDWDKIVDLIVNNQYSKSSSETELLKKDTVEHIKYIRKMSKHWCYDDKTEIFSDRGWVLFKDLTNSDKVANVSGWENDNFEFNFVKPLQIHDCEYRGDMITLESSKLSYCVTPGHKMLIDKRSSKGWKGDWFTKNSEVSFGEEKRIRTKVNYSEEGQGGYLDGYLHGFLLGDGYGVSTNRVMVGLKRQRKIVSLTKCLDSLGVEYTCKVDSEGVTRFKIHYSERLYNQDKEKTFDIKNSLSKGTDYCKGVFQGLLDSGGCVKKNTYDFTSSSFDLKEGFSFLATLLGYNPVQVKSRHLDNPKHKENFRISLQTRDYSIVNSSRDKQESKERLKFYDGKVYCVTVPSGMTLVRRDGRQMVCGNTPFAHCQITLIEEVPLAIFAQREKHDIGFIGGKSMVENSVSRRYRTDEVTIYSPVKWRKKPDGSIKQGSGEDFDEATSLKIQTLHDKNVDTALETYYALLDAGVAPEQARFELPTGTMTKYMVTGSLYAYANAYIQRSDSHAQKEIQELASYWDAIIRPLYPVSWAALVDGDYE